jgi:general secretion pathway protein M
MRDGFKIWWRTRTLREQRLMLAMFGLFAAVIAWLLIIRPLNDALSEARERHGRAATAVAEARARVDLIRNLQKAPAAPLGGPLDSVISQAATEAGFTVSRVEREGVNSATMVVDAVRPQAFFSWVDQMESSRGLVVERLRATANSDQTLSIQITFRTRSG